MIECGIINKFDSGIRGSSKPIVSLDPLQYVNRYFTSTPAKIMYVKSCGSLHFKADTSEQIATLDIRKAMAWDTDELFISIDYY